VDFDRVSALAERGEVKAKIEEFREEFGLTSEILALGVDRFDYTKGIPERIKAVDRLLEKYPEYKEKFVFFQTGPVSRLHVKAYKALNDEVNSLVEHVNWKHASRRWQPIVLARRHMNEVEMAALYRMADLCIVSSLHDGMNLVAKEFVAARSDGDGVLILSRFTGASRDLEQAVLINPYDIEGFSEGLREAIVMPEEERRTRMAKMRETIREHNVYSWAEQFVSQLSRLA
jgi:trehalose 6-phosphate synthase